ncbi:MAG: hypothetical protein IOD05_09665 [Rhodobacter sp.]|jgi:hypothetical protein|nr:hypothetical protein [Rhodobacter sp.]MCA3515278.1 hypothetical protein [Rhodobacter sp.]MCE2737062.1 hypothetical protein [Rhodobacter sp.]
MRAFDACLPNTSDALGDLVVPGVAHPCTPSKRSALIWRNAEQARVTGAVSPWFWMHR